MGAIIDNGNHRRPGDDGRDGDTSPGGRLVAVPEPLTAVATVVAGTRAAPTLTVRTIGNAVVVHPEDRLSEDARLLALSVAADARHQLVVLDLPEGSTAAAWDRVASLLPRPRKGLRLVVRGRSPEASALAAHWLAARLGRPVVAPDGHVSIGFGGSLYVDPVDGGGWMRFQGKKAASFVGARYPRPAWESDTFNAAATTSAAARVEPLPGGMWLHAREEDDRVRAHRDRLRRGLPCQQDLVPLVLGCPGDRPLSLDDVVRFWRTVPEGERPRLRPLRYGPLATTRGSRPWGQELADLLDEEVVCYTGITAGSLVDPDVHTVTEDGVLGWNSAAREVSYSPSAGTAAQPELRSHRAPLNGVQEISPRVYWYAPEAVVEVLQCGLWIRPPAEPVDADVVRAVQVHPDRHLLVVDDRDPVAAPRLRQLAADVADQLDQPTRRLSELQPSSVLVRSNGGVVPPGVRISGRPAAVAPPAPPAVVTESTVSLEEDDTQLAAAQRDRSVMPPLARTPATSTVVEAPASGPAPEAVPVQAPDAEPVTAPTIAPAAAPAPPAPAPPAPAPPAPPAPAPTVAPDPAPAVAPVGVGPATAPPLGLEPTAGTPAPEAPAPVVPPAAPTIPSEALPTANPDGSHPSTTAEAPAAEGAQDQTPGATGETGWQATPTPDAAALLPESGLDKERSWLTRAMSRQFTATSNGVARVLSENPAFSGAVSRGHGELLTDAVAARLYLGPDGDGLNDALRRSRPGPHVPFARCAASGFARLPTHRGVTATALTVDEAQWRRFGERRQFTDWGFLEVLTRACPADVGNTDVLVWSLTGRRVRSLEPDPGTPERVCFLPGTRFTVLELQEPTATARGHVLLREIAAVEVDDDGAVGVKRSALDDLAAGSLRRALTERGPEAADPASTGRAPRTLPGLVDLVDLEGAGAS